MQLPAILIPYPTAADNHQYFNARAFVQSGAARMLQQETMRPQTSWQVKFSTSTRDILKRSAMQRALAAWHTPAAAAGIAEQNFELAHGIGKNRSDAGGVKLKALSC